MGEAGTEVEGLLDKYREEGIDRVKLAVTDLDGVMNGKYLTMEKFSSVLESGGPFCDVLFGWDLNDRLHDNITFTGWHTGYPDSRYNLDLTSERRLVEEGNMPFFIGSFAPREHEEFHPVCPRNLLCRVLKRASEMGYGVKCAFEYEFFIFDETPHSVREKGFRDMKPLSPGSFGYSVLRSSALSDLFTEFMDYMESLDCHLEGLHCETGPGVWEGAIRYDDALRACDKAAIFKTFSKVFFQKRGLITTFMAKWSPDEAGQSGHLHMSLYDGGTTEPLFHDRGRRSTISEPMEQFMAGQIHYMRPFLAMVCPTINSYTRLVEGAWAPTGATWGIDNRTTALRAIPGSPASQRIEYRIAAADGNPYLVAAAAIASGLLGIEQKLELTGGVTGNAYEAQDKLPDAHRLPGNLLDAARIFRESREAREVFGETFVEHYSATREWEAREHQKAITDWQLERYFEIV